MLLDLQLPELQHQLLLVLALLLVVLQLLAFLLLLVQLRFALRHGQLLQEVVDRQAGHDRPLPVPPALTGRCPAARDCPAKAVRNLPHRFFVARN